MGARRFFIYAPPLKGVRESRRRALQPPYNNAPPYKCSVYYFWWEYLKRNTAYQRTCVNGGKGKLSSLYEDFGDIYSSDFWTWWRNHSELFAEPLARVVSLANDRDEAPENTILVSIPLENRASLSVRQFRKLIKDFAEVKDNSVTVSRARYQVASKPHLPSLYQHLLVWDAKLLNPKMDDADIADIAGISINNIVNGETIAGRKSINMPYDKIERVLKRRKALAVQRHLRIAKQYIDNVGKGKFPLRSSR